MWVLLASVSHSILFITQFCNFLLNPVVARLSLFPIYRPCGMLVHVFEFLNHRFIEAYMIKLQQDETAV